MLDQTNCLQGNFYKNFQTHQIKELIKGISPERRKELADEIRVRANITGVKNETALKVALSHLEGGK